MPMVLSWATLPSAPWVGAEDSSGDTLPVSLIDNGLSGVRFTPKSSKRVYVVVSNPGTAAITLNSLTGQNDNK